MAASFPLIGAGAGCTPAYQAAGRPIPPVEPGAAPPGTEIVGILGYHPARGRYDRPVEEYYHRGAFRGHFRGHHRYP